MSHVYFSSPSTGGSDFETVQIDGDYTAPLPTGAVLAIYVDATIGPVTVDLPETALGKAYVIKKIDATANQVVVDVDNGGSIDGVAATIISAQNESYFVQWESTGKYYIDADYNPAGSGAIPTLAQVATAGNDAGTTIIATQFQAMGVQTVATGVYVATLGISLYLVDLSAGDVTFTFPTGAAALGAIFSFQVITVAASPNRLLLNQTNGGVVALSIINETATVQCFSVVGLAPYKRISPAVRVSADLYALTVPAGVTFNIPHRLRSQPDSANIVAANAAAQGVIAGGYHITTDGTNIIVTLIAPVGAPVPGCQFLYQAFARG